MLGIAHLLSRRASSTAPHSDAVDICVNDVVAEVLALATRTLASTATRAELRTMLDLLQ